MQSGLEDEQAPYCHSRDDGLLRQLLEAIPGGVAIALADDPAPVLMSAYGRRSLGDDWLAPITDPNCPIAYYRGGSTIPATLDELIPSRCQAGEVIEGEEWRLVRRDDGTETFYSVSGVPLRNGAGTIIGTLACFMDISGQKATEARLREALEAKEALMRELAHRVKNNFQMVASLLTMQALRSADPTVREQLEDAIGRIQALAAINERLYRSSTFDGTLRLDVALEELCRDYAPSLAHHIRLETTTEPVTLAADRATPILLLANEAISNAAKHAFPEGREGVITVRLARQAEGVRLEIADDGIGMDPTALRSATLGMTLIGLLSDQAGGRPDIQGTGGTRITLMVPEG